MIYCIRQIDRALIVTPPGLTILKENSDQSMAEMGSELYRKVTLEYVKEIAEHMEYNKHFKIKRLVIKINTFMTIISQSQA